MQIFFRLNLINSDTKVSALTTCSVDLWGNRVIHSSKSRNFGHSTFLNVVAHFSKPQLHVENLAFTLPTVQFFSVMLWQRYGSGWVKAQNQLSWDQEKIMSRFKYLVLSPQTWLKNVPTSRQKYPECWHLQTLNRTVVTVMAPPVATTFRHESILIDMEYEPYKTHVVEIPIWYIWRFQIWTSRKQQHPDILFWWHDQALQFISFPSWCFFLISFF